jgi:hypothetical protein
MKIILYLIALMIAVPAMAQQASQYTIDLARMFSKDLFSENSIAYLSPMVKTVNATSNSGFFNDAYVPRRVDKAYFKISLHGMTGFVNESDKMFNPKIATKPFDLNDISNYGTASIDLKTGKLDYSIKDTAGLIHYFFQNILHDGIYGNHKGYIELPEEASTVLGDKATQIKLPHENLKELVESHYLYPMLPEDLKNQLVDIIGQFPETFNMYEGAGMNSIYASVPQLEIGALWGTELLIRFIPEINLGQYIGDFMFWGVGLKHSISQYFYKDERDKPFDLAAQIVFQGTRLKNEVGVTKAQLDADANIFSANIHASKSIKDWFDIFAGIAYDNISIDATYTYTLPIEVQWELGLIERGLHVPTAGYPGDTQPQVAEMTLKENNVKAVFGIAKDLSNLRLFLDYNIGKFNILQFGLSYKI